MEKLIEAIKEVCAFLDKSTEAPNNIGYFLFGLTLLSFLLLVFGAIFAKNIIKEKMCYYGALVFLFLTVLGLVWTMTNIFNVRNDIYIILAVFIVSSLFSIFYYLIHSVIILYVNKKNYYTEKLIDQV